MTNAEPLFIDTNILVYANVATAPFHKQALSALTTKWKGDRFIFWSQKKSGRPIIPLIADAPGFGVQLAVL